MSQTFTLVCPDLGVGVWVGQGGSRMTNFYSGMPEVMENLGKFLEHTRGKSLVLVCDDQEGMDMEYEAFEGEGE